MALVGGRWQERGQGRIGAELTGEARSSAGHWPVTGSVTAELTRPFGLPIALTALHLELRYDGNRVVVSERLPLASQQLGAINLTGRLSREGTHGGGQVQVHLAALDRLQLAAHLALIPPARD